MKFAFVNTFNDLCFREHILTSGDRPFFYRKPSPLASRLDRLLTALRSMCSQRRGAFFYFLLCEHRTKPASHCHKTLRTISPRLSCPPSPISRLLTKCSTSRPSSYGTSPTQCATVSMDGSRLSWATSLSSMTNAAKCSSTSSPRLSRAFLSVNPCCYDHR